MKVEALAQGVELIPETTFEEGILKAFCGDDKDTSLMVRSSTPMRIQVLWETKEITDKGKKK
jgi:hypothetical protein